VFQIPEAEADRLFSEERDHVDEHDAGCEPNVSTPSCNSSAVNTIYTRTLGVFDLRLAGDRMQLFSYRLADRDRSSAPASLMSLNGTNKWSARSSLCTYSRGKAVRSKEIIDKQRHKCRLSTV
jgi:hypothetical protein